MVPALLSLPICFPSSIRANVRTSRGFPWLSVGSVLLVGGCALMALAGCQMFSRTETGDSLTAEKRSLLSPLRSAPDAIQLNVVLIDRRADDPLIGPLLWREMDQVGAVPVETQELLAQNGCLVGHAASKPPAPLLRLLGIVPEIDQDGSAGSQTAAPTISGRTYSVRSGTETEVQISDSLPNCDVTLVETKRTRTEHFEQARCIFRLKTVRLQDGWVRVDFIPELHHGEMRLRQTATEAGWALQSGQNVEKCVPQQFSVTLNVGESVVVSADANSEGTLGDVFFRRDMNGERRQRLLVVRLADMGRAKQPLE